MTSPIQRLVVAVDETDLDDAVLAAAVAHGRTAGRSEIHLAHAVEPMPPPAVAMATSTPAMLDLGRALLKRTAAVVTKDFQGSVFEHLIVGPAAREVLQLAADLEADLLIVGSHGKRGLARLVLGSVSERIVRQAHCPVLVVRRKEYVPGVPEIEPPCPRCVETRNMSDGKALWCEAHTSKRTMHAHLHYETAAPFAVGSLLIRPGD